MLDGSLRELQALGLTPFLLQRLQELTLGQALDARVAGRVTCERRGEYEVLGSQGSLRATLAGRLEHQLGEAGRPLVGDWVLVAPANPVGRIEHLLERQNVLRRASVDGTSRAQALAANIDLCCVVAALTSEQADKHARRRALNPRRIERYLRLASENRIPALVLLNKGDLLPAEELARCREELARRLPEARLLCVSARTGLGLAELGRELPEARTGVLLGSSGVGKSTLVNALLGRDAQRVGSERAADARGRHTTTERQLLRLANGALLIDTPGMRELGLWSDAAGSEPDQLAELAGDCRFRDCRHQGEPGCAVLAAIEQGLLDRERLEHAHKLERELSYQRARTDVRLRTEQQRNHRAQQRALRKHVRSKD